MHKLQRKYTRERHLKRLTNTDKTSEMLNFIVPLKSPKVSNDWEIASQLCNRTLYSICQQTSSRFRVVLVCNEAPVDCYQHESLEIIEGDFSVPSEEGGSMGDKFRKVIRGANRIKEHMEDSEFFMVVDADDLVNEKLAHTAKENKESNGWYFERGYIYPDGGYWVYEKKDFHNYCGTSSIVKCKKEDITIYGKDEDRLFPEGHTTIRKEFKKRGREISKLPFIGACYTIETEENHSKKRWSGWNGVEIFMKKITSARPIFLNSIRKKFGMKYEKA